MNEKMFCFQCQEAAKGTGCVLKGVCGKESQTSAIMDLLLFVVRGVSVAANGLRENSIAVDKEVNRFVIDALFITITNANFDDDSIKRKVDEGIEIRNNLISQAKIADIALPLIDELQWEGLTSQYEEKSRQVGVLRETNQDVRSLKELIV